MKKKYQVCGLGNGLVDLQVQIKEDILPEIGIKKGEMILVDADRQKKALEKIAGMEIHKCSGGSAANTLIAFQKFGGIGAYFTSLGRDEFGEFYANEFKDIGIDLRPAYVEDIPTGICLVLITPDSERSMHTSLSATAFLAPEHIRDEVVADSEWLYLEGYKFSEKPGAEANMKALKIAKASGAKVAVSFSDVFIVNLHKENLTKIIKESDLIFCNEAEALAYTEKESVKEAFEELKTICPNVALTLGANGSLVHWNGVSFKADSAEATPIDTTGAGDMYAAGFLFGVVNGWDGEKSARLASIASAKVVSQLGARLAFDHKKLLDLI